MQYFRNIIETIGDTPLVKLNNVVSQIPALVLAKIETFNPGHSIKDRIGIKMIQDAEAYSRERIEKAEGQAKRFLSGLYEYKKALELEPRNVVVMNLIMIIYKGTHT